MEKFRHTLFAGIRLFLFIGYGMTEIGPTGLENPSMNKPGGFFPFPNFELKVCLF